MVPTGRHEHVERGLGRMVRVLEEPENSTAVQFWGFSKRDGEPRGLRAGMTRFATHDRPYPFEGHLSRWVSHHPIKRMNERGLVEGAAAAVFAVGGHDAVAQNDGDGQHDDPDDQSDDGDGDGRT